MPTAPVIRPMMLLNASEPPRLSRARQMQMKSEPIWIWQVSKFQERWFENDLRTIAFTGNGVFWTTVMRLNHFGNGSPSSRVNGQACLDAAAVELIAMPNDTTMIGTVMPMAPAGLPTAVLNTSIHGNAAVESTIWSLRSWMTEAYWWCREILAHSPA